MKIIRDDSPIGNMFTTWFTTCLGIEWNIHRCNIKGCTETSLGAIITGVPECRAFGVCEFHYQKYFSQPMDVHIVLDFTPLWYIDPDDEYGHEWRMWEDTQRRKGA
jgi:hypothetical protein